MASRVTLVLVAALLGVGVSAHAVDKNGAAYVGGTVAGVHPATEGTLGVSSETAMVFTSTELADLESWAKASEDPTEKAELEKERKEKEAFGRIEVPWAAITDVEYGQKAGKKLGILSRRQHFLTVTYTDPRGKEQAAIFELGTEAVQPTLTAVELRTGRKVALRPEEPRKP